MGDTAGHDAVMLLWMQTGFCSTNPCEGRCSGPSVSIQEELTVQLTQVGSNNAEVPGKGGPSSFSSHLKQGLVHAVAGPKTATAASSAPGLDDPYLPGSVHTS